MTSSAGRPPRAEGPAKLTMRARVTARERALALAVTEARGLDSALVRDLIAREAERLGIEAAGEDPA